MSIHNKIAEAIGVTPPDTLPEPTPSNTTVDVLDADDTCNDIALIENHPVPLGFHRKDIPADYHRAQKTIKAVMEHGESALEELLQLAGQTSKARDYEVASTIMKTLMDASKDLLETHKQIEEMEERQIKTAAAQKEQQPSHGAGSTNIENVYIQNTTQLLSDWKKAEEADEIVDADIIED